MDLTTSNRAVIAVVLAAGTSRRFGSTKQLERIENETLIAMAAKTAASVVDDRVIVIAGADWQYVTQSAAHHSRFFSVNQRYEDGIGTSIALAARHCERRADAMLLMLADQPLITGAHLSNILDLWSGNPREIVASAYANTVGPPILFPRATFAALTQLRGDRGANALLHDPRFNTVSIPFADAAVDIDTRNDLRRYKALLKSAQR